MKNILKKKERDDEYNKNGIRFKIETQNIYSEDEKFEDLRTLLDNLAWRELEGDYKYSRFNDDYEEQLKDGLESESLGISNLIEEYNYWKIDSETLLVESSTESNELWEEAADENESDDESNLLKTVDVNQSVTLSHSWHYHSTMTRETHL